jgi:predicted ArsR family transcriptional regulator
MTQPASSVLSNNAALDLTGALADPTRYGIYQVIVEAAGEPLTVIQVADRFNLHPNVARMHLRKLVDVSLVRADTRKSKGGGRPARIYRLSNQGANLQFPPRDYRTLAALALQAVTAQDGDPADALELAGTEFGREEGRRGLKRDDLDPKHCSLDQVLESLSSTLVLLGLFPRIERQADGHIDFEIRNCVYRELSAQFPGLVCRLHTAVLRGMLEEYLLGMQVEAKAPTSTDDSSCSFLVRTSTRLQVLRTETEATL